MGNIYIDTRRLLSKKWLERQMNKHFGSYKDKLVYKVFFPFKSISFEPNDTKYYRGLVNWLNAIGILLAIFVFFTVLFEYKTPFFIGILIIYVLIYNSARVPYLGFEKDLKRNAIRRFEEENKWAEADDIKETMWPDY